MLDHQHFAHLLAPPAHVEFESMADDWADIAGSPPERVYGWIREGLPDF
jgi:hypothetical protein